MLYYVILYHIMLCYVVLYNTILSCVLLHILNIISYIVLQIYDIKLLLNIP